MQIKHNEEHTFFECDEMILEQTSYDMVKIFKSYGSKERVSISNTGNTNWYAICDKNKQMVGCCGLYLAKDKCRIKGDYIFAYHRGKGYGEFITQCRMLIAKYLDYKLIEVLTLHPHYYEKKGFTIHKETRKGVWLATLEI